MSININIALVALAALLALFPSNSSAQIYGGCTIRNSNGDDFVVFSETYEIEGTGDADTIDCSLSFKSLLVDGTIELNCINNEGHFISGGGGNDIITGSECDDKIDGGASDDDIYGLGGNDIIFGGVGASPASGVSCEYVAVVEAGRIFLAKGGSGDDYIEGGEGNDCINAGSGEDEVYGGPGNDTIYGGNHADLIIGGLGVDYIDGGWHTDTCVDDSNEDEIHCENIVPDLEDPDGEYPGGGGPNCDNKSPDHPKCSRAS